MSTENEYLNKHAELSSWCFQQAENYLRSRNNIQASEKGWGAAAQALKAIAEERGWNHRGHNLIVDVAQQLSDEQNRPEIVALFGFGQLLHVNFYEDVLATDTIRIYLDQVRALLPELERIRGIMPPEFTPETRDQQNRWRRLTRGS